jgi:hypothetical protein
MTTFVPGSNALSASISQQPNESLRAFLDRRARELRHQISALRGQLAPKEAELAEIIHVQASLTIAGGAPVANQVVSNDAVGLVHAGPADGFVNSLLSSRPGPAPVPIADQRYADMTIKQLVIQALLDYFPNGATATQIRDFIRDAYGRVIDPSSLRPQMHRLKADEVLGHEPSTDTWNFRDGKRGLYAMYDHPTSRKAMKELQDEAPAEDKPG